MIVACFFALNLLMLIANVARFLIPLRVNSVLLALFYVLAALNNMARLAELVFFVVQQNFEEDQLPSLTNPDDLKQQIFDVIANTTNICLGFLFVATMY